MDEKKLEDVALALEDGQGDNKKWLTFWLQNQLFGVSILNVEQIVSMLPITEMPEYPGYAKGIINMRGEIVPVIDLRMRLGKPEVEYSDHTCIIISNAGEEHIGFIVDEVDAVIDISDEVISPPPKMGEDGVNRYLTGIARITDVNMKESVILCLNAEKVLLKDEIQSLEMGKAN